MIASLIRKELRQMLPFLALVVFMGLANTIYILLSSYPDQCPLTEISILNLEELEFYSIIYFFLAFVLAQGLLVREYDQRNMEFLNALPLSRGSLFLAKVVIGMAVLMIMPTLEVLLGRWLIAGIIESRPTPAYGPWMAQVWIMSFCQCYLFFAFGLAVSYLRRFAWLAAGLVLLLVMLLEHQLPALETVNPANIFPPVVLGSRIVFPWTACIVALITGTLFMSMAYAAFRFGSDRWSNWYGGLKNSRWGAGVLLFTSIVIAIGGFALFMWMSYEKYGDDEEVYAEYTFHSAANAKCWTDHYAFVYPSTAEKAMEPLVRDADEVGLELAKFFDLELAPPISVEITPSLQQHHAAVAFWNRVRIDASQLDDPPHAKAVLAHETTHVLIDRLSDRRLEDRFNSTKMFHEGLATYLEYRFYRTPVQRSNYRLQAVVYHDREQVRFEEMADYMAFREKYAADIIYPLGERFVDAIVKEYGDEAVPTLLKAFDSDEAPEGLEGEELWQDVFQRSEYDLDLVIDEFFALLDRDAEKTRDQIDALPRLYAHVGSDAGNRIIELDDPPDGKVYCAIRQTAQTDEQYHFYAEEESNGRFTVSRWHVMGDSFWYRLMYYDETSDIYFSEPWVLVNF